MSRIKGKDLEFEHEILALLKKKSESFAKQLRSEVDEEGSSKPKKSLVCHSR